jgi:hypothetical protein
VENRTTGNVPVQYPSTLSNAPEVCVVTPDKRFAEVCRLHLRLHRDYLSEQMSGDTSANAMQQIATLIRLRAQYKQDGQIVLDDAAIYALRVAYRFSAHIGKHGGRAQKDFLMCEEVLRPIVAHMGGICQDCADALHDDALALASIVKPTVDCAGDTFLQVCDDDTGGVA